MSAVLSLYRRLLIQSSTLGYLFALACVATAVGLRLAIELWTPGVAPFAALFPAILMAAVIGGLGPGLLALVLSILAAWQLFAPWASSPAMLSRTELTSLLLVMTSGGLVVLIGATLHLAVRRLDTSLFRLEANERRLKFALEAGRLGIAWFDVPSQRGGWSATVSAMLGLPAANHEVTYEEWRAFVLPEDREAADATLAEALTSEDGFYRTEYRVRRLDGAVRTLEFRGAVTRDEQGAPMRLDGVAADITERRRAEARHRQLVNELNHRVKNTLAIVQGLAAQTARTAPSIEAFTATLSNRIRAFAASHDLLTEHNWDGAPLRRLLEIEVAPYDDPIQPRIRLFGPDVVLPPRMVAPIGLIVHELTTNAVKYGALKEAAGEVAVSWSVEGEAERRLQLSWQERGGPPVVTPARRGFGSRLIDRSVTGELGGELALQFAPEGISCEIAIPLEGRRALAEQQAAA